MLLVALHEKNIINLIIAKALNIRKSREKKNIMTKEQMWIVRTYKFKIVRNNNKKKNW